MSNGASLSWHLVFLPSYIADVLVANLLVRQRKYTHFYRLQSRMQHRMLRAYGLIAGFPLGTAFKVLLGLHLETGSRWVVYNSFTLRVDKANSACDSTVYMGKVFVKIRPFACWHLYFFSSFHRGFSCESDINGLIQRRPNLTVG